VAINGNIFFPREKYVWKFEVNFSDFIDKFWGIGNGTQKNQEEGYSFVQIFLSTQVDKKILGGAFAGLGWDYQHVITTSYTKNGWFDKDNVIGKDPYQISGPTFYFTYDTRNHSYIPNRGNYFKLKYGGFFPFTGSDYRFDQVEIDYRTFYKIYKKWVIAAQVYQYYTFGDTPFRSLAQMGGGYTMRGYYAGRFRDKLFITSQAELRYPIYWRFSGTIFAGVGEVARKFEDFRFEKIKHSIGAGLRFNLLPKDNLNLRFDVAMGNYGNINFYVLLAESF
jgi:outer membrane protein assembly factor BamA